MRRLLVFTSAIVFFDVAFYAAIAPLLPDYVHEFGLSQAEAGVLAAAYAAGTLAASLPAGFVAGRVGPRRTVISGLLLLGGSSVVFGFAESVALLDGARFAQGISGALIWSGALTWLIGATAPERRGSAIGTALGTAVAGALIGPIFGSVAAEVGTEIVFCSVMALTLVLSVIATTLPEVAAPERQTLGEVVDAMLSRPIVTATLFVAIPSLMFGAVEVLVPLRIDELGGGHAASPSSPGSESAPARCSRSPAPTPWSRSSARSSSARSVRGSASRPPSRPCRRQRRRADSTRASRPASRTWRGRQGRCSEPWPEAPPPAPPATRRRASRSPSSSSSPRPMPTGSFPRRASARRAGRSRRKTSCRRRRCGRRRGRFSAWPALGATGPGTRNVARRES